MTTRNRELASIIDDSGNITTGGNLSVTGNLTQSSSTTTTYSDGLLELNNGAGSNSNDLGLVMERGSTGDNAIFLWDESNDGFAVGTTTATGSATGNISFSAAPFTASTITGTILTGSTSLKTPLIEFTDGDDALTIADGGLVTTSTHFSIGGSNNELRFYEGSNYVGFEAPALSADQIWVLPTADGSSGQLLKTDGSGNLSFTDDLTLANASVNNFSGDGSTTGFTLSSTPVTENTTMAYINGVYQFKNTYSVSGTTFTFDAAPANGASIEIIVWSTVAVNVPADSSVTSAKLSGDLTAPGTLTANAGVIVDNITIDGTEIDLSSGDLTIDVAGDIILDADGGDIRFKDAGTEIGALENSSSDLQIKASVQDKDIIFKGNDGGSTITALTLDMSGAGYASFNDGITLKNGIFINNADASATAGYLYNDSNDFVIRSYTQDKDIIFKGNDGGSVITAMTIDMSAAGNVGIGTTTATNAKLEVVATSGEVLRADANSGAYRLVADQDGVIMNGNVGVGNSNPQHPFVVHLTDGEIAMFGSNGMNSVGDYCGIGIGQVLANNTTYQKVSIVAEGRDNGNYVQNLHFLVDIASDANSAVLTDSKMMVSGAYGHVGIGTTLMSYQAGGTDLHPLYVQTTASNGTVATNGFVHIGPTAGGNANSDGYITGISLGYHENNASYQHTAIAVRAHGDGAARRDMAFLVNTASEAASAALGDAKLTISSGNGVVSGDLNDTSDLGFKENVADLGNTLSIVNQLKPRTFKWKDRHASRGDSVGFIAQEIQSVVDNNTLVQGEAFDPDGIPGPGLSLNTIGIVAYLTKAIQELSTELDAAKARITTLEG